MSELKAFKLQFVEMSFGDDIPDFTCRIKDFIGDGLTEKIIPKFKNTDLLITDVLRIRLYNDAHVSSIINFHQLKSLTDENYNRIIIDRRIPRLDSRTYKELTNICRGKIVIFAQLLEFEKFTEVVNLIKNSIDKGIRK